MKRAFILIVALLATACTPKTAEQQIAEAMRLLEEGEKVAAIVELKNAVVNEPNNTEARFQLGLLEFEQGLWEESEKEMRRAIDLGYPVVESYPILIKSIYYQNDFARVQSELEVQPQINDPQIISTLSLFEYLAKLKSGEQSPVIPTERLLEEELLIAQAYQTLESGKPDVALNITEQFTSPKSEPFEKLLLKGIIASLIGSQVEAIIAYSEALEIFPTYHVARFLLAEQLIEDKQLNRAEDEVNKLLALNPNSGHANYLKSLIHFYQNNYELALQLANLALQNNAKPALASFIAGTSAYRTGRLESALRLLETAANTLPPTHPTHRLLAQVKLELGYVEDVASNLDDLNIEPGQGAEIYSLAALQKLQLGEQAKSKEFIDKAKTLDPNNPVGLLREGYILLNEDQARAVDSLSKALNIDPNLSEAWVLLAQVKFNEEGLDAALEVAQQWGEINELNGELLKGIIYLRANDEPKANQHFAEIIKYDQDNIGALRYLMIGEARQDNFESAMEYAKKLLTLTPDNLQNLIDVVNIMIAQEQEDQIMPFLKSQAQANPQASAPISAQAFIYLRNDEPQKAISLLKSVDDPQSFGIYQALGDAYIETKAFDQALDTYRDWTKKFPTDIRGWYRLIATYQYKSDFEGAMAITRQARRYIPQDKRLILLTAHLAASTGKFAQSKQAIETLEQSGNELANLTHTRGLLALNEKRFDDAVTLLSASYETTPGFGVARLLAFALAGNDNAEKGLSYLLGEVDNSDDNLLYKMVTAEFASNAGFHQQAIGLYERALQQSPNNFAALNNLANAQLLSGDFDAALATATQVLDMAPDSEYALDTYGYVLLKTGDIEKGLTHIEKALGKAPNNKEIQLHNVEALILSEDWQRATTMLRRIRPNTPLQESLYLKLKEQISSQENQ